MWRPEPYAEPDLPLPITVDEPTLYADFVAFRRRSPLGPIAGGVLVVVLSAIVVAGLLYQQMGPPETPAVVAKQNGRSIGGKQAIGIGRKKDRPTSLMIPPLSNPAFPHRPQHKNLPYHKNLRRPSLCGGPIPNPGSWRQPTVSPLTYPHRSGQVRGHRSAPTPR